MVEGGAEAEGEGGAGGGYTEGDLEGILLVACAILLSWAAVLLFPSLFAKWRGGMVE